MKKVYIMLSKTSSKVGNVIRFFTKYKYNHVSISFDDEFQKFYSFSRLNINTPLIGGFTIENRNTFTLGKYKSFPVKIFKIELTDKEYYMLQDLLDKFNQDKEIMYNYASTVTTPILKGIDVYKSYNCSTFAAYVLEKIGKIKLDKPYYKYVPKDFENLLNNTYLYYEGNLEVTDDLIIYNKNFMKKQKKRYVFWKSISCFSESFYRLIFHRDSYN